MLFVACKIELPAFVTVFPLKSTLLISSQALDTLIIPSFDYKLLNVLFEINE